MVHTFFFFLALTAATTLFGASPVVTFDSRGQLPPWVDLEDMRLLHTNNDELIAHAVVATDGSGSFPRIMDAIHAAPNRSTKRYVIRVRKGVYNEIVDVNEDKWNIMMIGDGMDVTIISGSLSSKGHNLGTYDTATFGVEGRGFIAQDISFRNTAGPQGEQAVALRSSSDLSIFYRCDISGYQDTLYILHTQQFYSKCIIRGTIDFIFGDAFAVFQYCDILVKKCLPGQQNVITAQGETIQGRQSAFSFQFCNISTDVDLLPFVSSIPTYLGRPWKQFSKTIFMQSYMSGVLSPKGWLEWNGSLYLNTLYYGEYKNYGPGARTDRRVRWPGYHVIIDSRQASKFTVSQLIMGEQWIPPSRVPFTPGLGN